MAAGNNAALGVYSWRRAVADKASTKAEATSSDSVK